MDTVLSINLISSNPDVRSGRPVVAGTGVCVSDVVMAMNYHQQDPDGIASWYGLSLAQVHAALSYYYEHKADVDAEVRERIKQARELKEKQVGSRP